MKRYFASTAAVALIAIPLTGMFNPAWAQKVLVPSMGKIPTPLLRRMHDPLKGKFADEMLRKRLMRKIPPKLLGKFPAQLTGNSRLATAGASPLPSMDSNPAAWMTQINNQSNQNVANIYKACISHPGACNGLASQSSLNDAINGVQTQSLIDSQHQAVNQNIQSLAVSQTNCAITGGQVLTNRTTGQKVCAR
jgi:hypothetical protein